MYLYCHPPGTGTEKTKGATTEAITPHTMKHYFLWFFGCLPIKTSANIKGGVATDQPCLQEKFSIPPFLLYDGLLPLVKPHCRFIPVQHLPLYQPGFQKPGFL